MPELWTGDIIGLMHVYKITGQELGEKLGVTNRYVSMILNGHRSPPKAEERFRAAIKEIIAGKCSQNIKC